MAASGWSSRRQGFPAPRSSEACASSRPTARCRRAGAGGPAAGASRPPRWMRRCCAISTPWSSRPPPAIRLAAALVLQEYAGAGGRAAGAGPRRQPHGRRRRCCTSWATRLQANVKTREGRQHPDRDAQFRYIAATVTRAQRQRQPTISVDTKKKELVGDFKNGGARWRRTGEPEHVRVHDFIIRAPGHGKAIPYGVYDLRRDEGWVSVGIDHDTASFAVNAIRRWWQPMGRRAYPRARSIVITADAGRQQWPARAPLEMGTAAPRESDRPDDHRLSFPARDEQVEQDRAPPLLAHRHELARHAAREPGGDRQPDCLHAQPRGPPRALRARSAPLPRGIAVTDAQMATVHLTRHAFHGDWNYTITPTATRHRRNQSVIS